MTEAQERRQQKTWVEMMTLLLVKRQRKPLSQTQAKPQPQNQKKTKKKPQAWQQTTSRTIPHSAPQTHFLQHQKP